MQYIIDESLFFFLRDQLGMMDKWILSRLSQMISVTNKNFEAYDLHLVTAAFTTFWQNHLCGVYLVRNITFCVWILLRVTNSIIWI